MTDPDTGTPARDAGVPATPRALGYTAASATVVASMIGTGVFTTLGFQAQAVPNGLALLAVWLFGGAIALCGAVSYAEIAVRVPRSGGEYAYLRAIYHPWLGAVAALASVLVGFSAAAALSSLALGRYLATLAAVSPNVAALLALWSVSALHLVGVSFSGRFQVATTALKLALIAAFCAAGLLASPRGTVDFTFGPQALDAMLTPEFGLAMLFASYAYSGWNAAVYVADEVREPARTLPRALLHGTALVTCAYLLLNFVFLRTVPLAELQGTVEVGALAAVSMFGNEGGRIVAAMLCIALVSSISAMVLVGPRVLEAVGRDYPAWQWLARRSSRGAPATAVLTQCAIATALVLTDAFEGLLTYVGFTLTLFTVLCVIGLFVLRRRAGAGDDPAYRTWGYPVTPAVFVLASVATLAAAVYAQPAAAIASLVTLTVAILLARR